LLNTMLPPPPLNHPNPVFQTTTHLIAAFSKTQFVKAFQMKFQMSFL
jgi:hypothetical protein